MKVKVSYATCTIFTSGLGDTKCFLCNADVKDGVIHECKLEEKPKPKRLKRSPR